LPELICNTSVIQSLHQLGLLDILPALASAVCGPGAVCTELAAGRALGVDIPDPATLAWATTRSPQTKSTLPQSTALGAGERDVLWLGMETANSVAVLDDRDARRVARQLGIALTGTLGLLVDAKQRALISTVAPLLDELERHNFHMSPRIRNAILKAAREMP
jgi:predicted nucleic acid-binding protein